MNQDKILIIDDEKLIFESIADALDDEYPLYYAENGEAGLKLYFEIHPILIILDIRMPVLDGFEFLKRMEVAENDPYSIIVLSGHADGTDIRTCYQMGIIHFLRKPFNIFELKGLVRHCISAKKQNQILLQEKNFARSIIDHSVSTIIVVDAHRNIKEFNRAAERLYGYSALEVIGQPVSMIYGDEAQHAQVGEQMRTKGFFSGEVISHKKNGTPFPVYISAAMLYDNAGNIIGNVGSSRDLTEEKQAEQDRRAKEEAQMANQAKSIFLANMSHEIRTPMNAIIGLTDLALKQKLSPKLEDYLTKVQSASRSLLRILNDILDFSKIEAGKMVLNPEPFNLQDLFEHLSDLFRQQLSNKDIELNLAIAAQEDGTLVGDVLRLEQVLINLLSNAIKFTQEGEIEVRSLPLDKEGDQICIQFSVRDTGIGIPADKITQFFQPFTQADGSHTRKYGGTGLGLAISKQIVEMMGGKIWVDSVLGEGSTFFFTITFQHQPSIVPRWPLPPADLCGIKILVVDDNAVAREIFTDILHALSFDPVMAQCGKEALAQCTAADQAGTPYPLVLMDWKLPGLNGIEISKRIKEMGNKTKIILLTPVGNDAIKSEAQSIGIDAFLVKPINRSCLFDTIMEVLGQDVPKRDKRKWEEADDTAVLEKIGGARILLVEDNRINQQVAREILEGVGVVVDIAENGLEAVHCVGQFLYDAVLMDVQMPEMDGYQATHRIRLDARFKELPIIAMTAHALASDREKCLSVGMNDHVTKPIEPQKLFATLMQWVQLAEKGTSPHPHLLKSAGQNDSELEILPDALPGINVASGLRRLRGNRTLFKSLLMEFLRDFSSISDRIRHSLTGKRQNDRETAGHLVHSIKGMAGNISAENLHLAAAALETAIEENHRHDWPPLLDRFENALDQVIASVQTLQHKKESETEVIATMAADPEKIQPLLTELAILIRWGDCEAEECFASLKPYLQDISITSEVQQLETSIGRFDFDTAKEVLSIIAKALKVTLEFKESS